MHRFRRMASLTVTTIHGGHVLAIPGRHEATALTDDCPDCLEPTGPASVLDEVRGIRTTGRIATYRCGCSAAWLCWWAAQRAPYLEGTSNT